VNKTFRFLIIGLALILFFAGLVWQTSREEKSALPPPSTTVVQSPESPSLDARTTAEVDPVHTASPLFLILPANAVPQALVDRHSPTSGQVDSSTPTRRVYRSLFIQLPPWNEILSKRPGQLISLPLFDGQMALAKVVLVRAATDQDPAAISGTVLSPFAGSFALVDDPRLGSRGHILPKEGERAYEFEMGESGQMFLDEVPRGGVVCSPMPAHPKFIPARKGAKTSASSVARGAVADVPVLRSHPGAKGVLYLDFDGATVTDPFWNDGATIQAQPSGLSNEKITEIWKVMSEDFLPFDVNVTTVETDYNNSTLGMRMRCIFTPTTDAAPGSGGVAYLGSFKWTGTTPCWAFNGTGTSATQSWATHIGAMTGSHELGHTFNLRHDGDATNEYFAGYGTGATSWGPIMGAPFNASVIQWSKGEYAGANNFEDDVAIISGSYFGVGYVSDDYGDSAAQAGIIPQSTKGVVSVSGLISKASDRDVFRLECGKGTVTINATGAPLEPNLDIKLELLNSVGTVIKSADPTGVQTASLSSPIPSQGTYYLRVSPGAEPNGSTSGWTTYGSIGAYFLTGSFPSMIGFADNFSEAASLPSGFSFSGIEASNVAATAESGEPAHDGLAARHSIWWKWSPGLIGRMKISTQGSNFDTVLAVYTGSSLSRLKLVASNDNVHPFLTYSEVNFPVTREGTYYIAVDGKSGGVGKIVLSGSGTTATGPENDNLSSASVLTGSTLKVRGSSFNATREEGEPEHRPSQSLGAYSGFCSVWFQWTAPSSGTYVISTEGSTFNTLLAVYNGPASGDLTPASLVPVSSKDKTPKGVSWDRVGISAQAGKTYYVAIDGFGRVGGSYALSIKLQ